MPVEAAPAAEKVSGAAAIAPAEDGAITSINPGLVDAILGLLALAASVPVGDSRANELRRAARTASGLSPDDTSDDDGSGMTPSTTAAASSGATTVDVLDPTAALASSALAADIYSVSAATADVLPLALAGDQIGVAPLFDVDKARGPPVATLATVIEGEIASSALAVDVMGAVGAEVLPLPLAGEQVAVAPFSDLDTARGPPVAMPAARGPPSAEYLLADASSPFNSAPAALSNCPLPTFRPQSYRSRLLASGCQGVRRTRTAHGA